MKTYHGKYVSTEPEVNANSNAVGPYEIWTLTFLTHDVVQLKGYHGKYLSVQNNGEWEQKKMW